MEAIKADGGFLQVSVRCVQLIVTKTVRVSDYALGFLGEGKKMLVPSAAKALRILH